MNVQVVLSIFDGIEGRNRYTTILVKRAQILIACIPRRNYPLIQRLDIYQLDLYKLPPLSASQLRTHFQGVEQHYTDVILLIR